MVRRVPGRRRHLELSSSGLKPFVAVQNCDPAGGHGQNAPHNRSMSSPYRRVALAMSFGRIDQVPSATLVHEHLDLGVCLQKSSGRAGVIEVDMRQQHLPHVANR